jgi:predicted nucleic acid-binding protein
MATLPNSLTPVFLDTAYIYALVNTRDQWHEQALDWQRELALERRKLVTTELILVEIADGLAAVKFRAQAATALAMLQASTFVDIVPFSSQLFSEAFDLYRSRPDKDWGMTDCASFVVMRERALSEALTMDEHFQQAGFRALLREE